MTVKAPLRVISSPRDRAAVWGCPWPRGLLPAGSPLALAGPSGPLAVQTWPLATWPDGSWKWTAHATPIAEATMSLAPGQPRRPEHAVHVTIADGWITVATAATRWRIASSGGTLISSIESDGRTVARNVRLVSLRQDGHDDEARIREPWTGHVDHAMVEQDGPVRAVVLLTGNHTPDGPSTRRERAWLPFRVRLEFISGSPEVRIQHSFIWDGRATDETLAGLGLRVGVPLRADPWNRHVRLAGTRQEDGSVGFLSEAVQGITGLRRDPGETRRRRQVEGRALDAPTEWPPAVADRLRWVPTWSDWRLDQLSPDGFTLAKRTSADCGWVTIPGGTRSVGYAYAGDVHGGVGLGQRDFWQTYPSGVDIAGMDGEEATLTSWLWSPRASAMDLRFYHDGLGQQGWADQLDAMDITYEDYEPGFGDALGVARTHELRLTAHAATPSQDELSATAAAGADPVVVLPDPTHLQRCGVFGDWAVPDRTRRAAAAIEDLLDELFAFYVGQQEDRRWYGFWDFGDVMHSYDPDRHQWRYDIGGFAWDNSELSPDLWLWYQVLRTGRGDVFRFAEAMSRHTGEVDVHHLGPFAGLGSRHNVQHWGCSAKQVRISSAIYRRIHCYLTADERVGDLLGELANAEHTFAGLDPNRKVRHDGYVRDARTVSIGLGTDWGALASAWLTAWERGGPDSSRAKEKLLGTMADIGELPQGFWSGEARMNLDTGRFDTRPHQLACSHLSAVFGLVEICAELIALTEGTENEQPGFADAWSRYCRFYLSSPEEQRTALGAAVSKGALTQAHSRLLAREASRTNDAHLASVAWDAFLEPDDPIPHDVLRAGGGLDVATAAGTSLLAPVRERIPLGTNGASQYALAAIQNLALIGELVPELPQELSEPHA